MIRYLQHDLLLRFVFIFMGILVWSNLSIISEPWKATSQRYEEMPTAKTYFESYNFLNYSSSFLSLSSLYTDHQDVASNILNTSNSLETSAWKRNISRMLLMGHYLGMTGADMALHSLAQVGYDSGATMEFYFPFAISSHSVHPKALKLHSSFKLHFDDWNLTQQPWIDYDCILVNTASLEATYLVFQRLSQDLSTKQMDLIYQKVIVWIHEFYTDYSASLELLMRRAKLLMFCSEAARKNWMIPFPWILNKSTILSPAISVERASSLLAIPRTQSTNTSVIRQLPNDIRTFSGNDTILLYVGSMSTKKGVPQLISSFVSFIRHFQPKLDSAFHLMLVGRIGKSSDNFSPRKLIQRANRKLERMPTPSQISYFHPNDELLPFYKVADIFILNSFSETLGMVIMEAMLAGLIVISRDCGGPASLLQNGITGFLLPNHSPNDVVGQVSDLTDLLLNLTRPTDWKESLQPIGVQARLIASSNFTTHRMSMDLDRAIIQTFGGVLVANKTME